MCGAFYRMNELIRNRTREGGVAAVFDGRNAFQPASNHELFRKRTLEERLAAVCDDWTAIRTMSPSEQCESVCMEAVRQNGMAVRYIDKHQLSEEICVAAVRQNPYALDFLDTQRRTPAVLAAARESGYDTRSEAVRKTWAMLSVVPPGQRGLATCLAAVKLNGYTIREMSDEERVPEVCLAAVCENGRAVKYLTSSQRTPAVCLEAVRENGLAIELLTAEQRSQAVCTAAVENNIAALNLLTSDQRTHEVVFAAVKRHWRFLRKADHTPLLWAAVIREYPEFYDRVPQEQRTAQVLASLYAAQQDRGVTRFDGLHEQLPLEIVLLNIFPRLSYKDLFD